MTGAGEHEGPQELQGTEGPLTPGVPKVGQSCSPVLVDPDCRWVTIARPRLDGRYWRLTVPADYRPHLVMDNNNKAYLHRLVLCDKIGPGPHTCNWCKWPGLRWDITDPKDPRSLVADHVNGRENDCRIANLVASCQWCNNNRSVVDDLGLSWALFEGLEPTIAARGSLYNHKTKAPTKTAFELAKVDAATSAKAGSGTGERAELKPASDPSPQPLREHVTPWADVFAVPAELVETYPFLRGKFGS